MAYQTFTEMVKGLLTDADCPMPADSKMPLSGNRYSSGTSPKPEREDILLYIDRIRGLLTDSWKAKYRQVWEEIIDHPTIAAVIYDKGRQVKTTFNRDLVGHIINYLGHHGMIEKWNASKISLMLENTVEHSVRTALRKDPPANIMEVLKDYIKDESKKKP